MLCPKHTNPVTVATTGSIDAIIMGSRISIQDFMKCQILATEYNLEIFKAEPDSTEFKINLKKYDEDITL